MIPKGSEEMKQVETGKLDEKEEGESVISPTPASLWSDFLYTWESNS